MGMHPRVGDSAGRGAYGLRLHGLDQAADMLVDAPGSWPDLTITRRSGRSTAPPTGRLGDQEAVVPLGDTADVVISRPGAEAVFTLPRPIPDRHIVHPYLSVPAAIFNRWLGRESFHAGAAVVAGGAWAICGPRGGGKSSTLGWLAANGVGVLTDDLLVLDGLEAMAGPRSIDLRQETAELLQAGVAIGPVGSRDRWRMDPGQVAASVPLLGWVFLAWGDSVEMVPVPPAERLVRLFQHESLEIGPARPAAYLDLAAVPGWELRRPERLASLPEAGRCLIETVTVSAAGRS